MRTGTDDKPLRRKEADDLREKAMGEHRSFFNAHAQPGEDYTPPVFTCETCVFLAWCEFAYNLYNTNGDCLASK